MSPPTPPLPVPSKAAIRALRGLVLGTTCSLALVTEDRRRRINAARSAVRNGDRIRSARQYHAGGSAFAIALEEESLAVEPGVIHWSTQEQTNMPEARGEPTRRTPKAKTATPPGLLDWTDVARPHRGARMSPKSKSLLHDEALEHALAARSSTEAPQNSPETRLPPITTSSAFPFPPLPIASTHIHRTVPSLARKAQEYQSRTRLGQRPPDKHEAVQEAAAGPAIDLSAATERIKELTKSQNHSDLEAAARMLLLLAPVAKSAADASSVDQLSALWNASASLCTACQDAGRMDLAQDVLRVAVKYGDLDEAVYFAHNPLPVVRSIAPVDELDVAGELRPIAGGEVSARRDVFITRLQDSTAMFLPAISSPTRTHSATELVAVGKQLLECAFAAHHFASIKAVYSSISAYPGDISEFSHWYIGQLHQAGHSKLLLSSFLARPPTPGSLTNSAFFELGNYVVAAARLNQYLEADKVLGSLLGSRAPTCRLRTSWITSLLYGHWQKTRSYPEIKVAFAQLGGDSKSISRTVNHADGAYRVMVQIALEAGEAADAQSLFDELAELQPTARGDIRLLGLFALAKAKRGDWQGVQDEFQTAMAAAGSEGLPALDAERVFVPIVKEYIRGHTIGETEDFLKLYVDEMGVPLGRLMVTLVANEYGALREVHSFISWLEYCAKAGFTVDAAFSNAILQNCRKHWKFGFRELRTMYRKLKVLSPNFEDKVTQTIMTHAAISDAKHIGRPVKGRVLSLRIQSPTNGSKVPPALPAGHQSQSHFLDEYDLYVSMKQAFASGYPAKAVRMYKHAMRGGMPPSAKCLKLAVGAAIRSGKQQSLSSLSSSSSSPPMKPTKPAAAEYDTAIDLLKTAHAAGQDIDDATAYLAIAYIDALRARAVNGGARGGKANVATAVKAILCRLDASDVKMSDLALNRAAFHMFKAGHMRGALALAQSAANSPEGGGRLGYNVWNFSVLVSAYARQTDGNGIRLATEGAVASGIIGELMGYKVLKQARRRLNTALIECEYLATVQGSSGKNSSFSSSNTSSTYKDDIKDALQAVEAALDKARAARRQLNTERCELETATIDIMRRAALNAGGGPVDFDKVPFLQSHRKQQQPSLRATDGDVSTTTAPATPISEEDGSSISSGSSWDLLDMPVDQDGRLTPTAVLGKAASP